MRDFHVSVNIVAWNSEKYLDNLLKSLDEQTFKDFQIIIIDNASSDGSLEKIRNRPDILLIKNSFNAGFSRAHNKGIEMAMKIWEGRDLSDRFVVVLNPDTVLESDCLENIILSIRHDGALSAVGPKLYRLAEENDGDISEFRKTDIVDSFGLEIKKSGDIVDRLAGTSSQEADEDGAGMIEVFGVSGAFACYRAAALYAARWGREYFDEDFFAYKEDADMAWRLRNLGWKAAIDCKASAFHVRRAKDNADFFQKLSAERKKSRKIKVSSVRNRLWTIWKNGFFDNMLIFSPFIIYNELSRFLYYVFFDFSVLAAYFSALRGLPKMFQKREYLKMAKIKSAEIRKWMR